MVEVESLQATGISTIYFCFVVLFNPILYPVIFFLFYINVVHPIYELYVKSPRVKISVFLSHRSQSRDYGRYYNQSITKPQTTVLLKIFKYLSLKLDQSWNLSSSGLVLSGVLSRRPQAQTTVLLDFFLTFLTQSWPKLKLWPCPY